ncbi:MAG: M18 family aminopeptidase [Deltaproteobacteria bacterium]|nr:M18 family aminopeptidase [Deltaproteobacteria bacterium]
MSDPVVDLLSFIDRSPTPYHAVAESARRLEAAGYQALSEDEVWDLEPGDQRYLVRHEGSLIAFQIGAVSPANGGFRIVGAHTDSPNLRIKPRPDIDADGYRQLGVEPYGGSLLHTWLDRDLSLAGRVTLRGEPEPHTLLIDFARPILRIPNLAIHLQRELNKKGLKLNAQQHMAPIFGLGEIPPLRELLVSELHVQNQIEVDASDVLAFDLMTYDVQPSVVSGLRGEFIHAARLDNLASCHAGLTALIGAGSATLPQYTRVVALYDHEEVGSRSAQGAASPLLAGALERSICAFEGGEPQGLERALSRSTLISVDMAHAVHPNYADRHEPQHRPVVGRGPVIKTNANQSYASDAQTAGLFAGLCSPLGIEPQHFVSRSDLGCGSTIGPITAARVGVRTVDVGNPMLSMHSCREMAGTADVEPMIDVLRSFLGG